MTLTQRAEQVVKDVWGRYSYAPIDQPELIAAIASALRAVEAETFEQTAQLYRDWCDGKWFDEMEFDIACKNKAAAIRARGAAKDTNG